MTRLSLLLLACTAFTLRAADLPPAVKRPVDFAKEIKPLLEETCVKCHAKGKEKGGLSLETRASFLKGGDSGDAATLGHSEKSLIVEMVAGVDPDNVMPKKGARWTPEQVGLLRAWIDQGAIWPENITFARPAPRNVEPPRVAAAEGQSIDSILARYLAGHQIATPAPVGRAAFLRRASLDAVGLLPSPEEPGQKGSEIPAATVDRLLGDQRNYAQHWLTFWNDLLRNDYKGAGFIDGGRKQISEWLYDSLVANKPYNQFVAELVNPDEKALGFTSGIIWRGNVAAAMTPPMQAAQSVSQVFLGINLKCASCHDSFVSDWLLADAYGMAAVFAEEPLELVRCDKPTGQKAAYRFLYPQVGGFDLAAPKAERLQRLATLMTSPKNGRLSRTLVNRLWARLFGRGLVEPLDDMDKPAWSPELLDWLASDFETHGFDVKRTLRLMMTSQAYQWPAVEAGPEKEFVFRGPLVRRLSAEQFADVLSSLSGEWPVLPSTLEFDLTAGGALGSFTTPQWIWTEEALEFGAWRSAQRYARQKADSAAAAQADAKRKSDAGAPDAAAAATKAATATQAADEMTRWAATQWAEARHKVVFRKTFQLADKPSRAYAALLVSQAYEVAVNGTLVRAKMTDGFRNGRVRLFDLTNALRAGENLIAVSVDSHTDKSMTDSERKETPASQQHLNAQSGLACYVAATVGGERVEIISDATWRTQRAPESNWSAPQLADDKWSLAEPLPTGVAPVDEGPGLPPLRRQDFANIPVQLGQPLRAVCSTAAMAGQMRASMLAADPLQVALDRPNREIVITNRNSTSTTIQALEMTNGATLSQKIDRAAAALIRAGEPVDRIYLRLLGRVPSAAEAAIGAELVEQPMSEPGVADLLWTLLMLPEFQFIR